MDQYKRTTVVLPSTDATSNTKRGENKFAKNTKGGRGGQREVCPEDKLFTICVFEYLP